MLRIRDAMIKLLVYFSLLFIQYVIFYGLVRALNKKSHRRTVKFILSRHLCREALELVFIFATSKMFLRFKFLLSQHKTLCRKYFQHLTNNDYFTLKEIKLKNRLTFNASSHHSFDVCRHRCHLAFRFIFALSFIWLSQFVYCQVLRLKSFNFFPD